MEQLIRKILKDLRVELKDEFDKNFERQAFFTESWQRRKSPTSKGRGNSAVLIDTGALRKSLKVVGDQTSVTIDSDLPYAAIHNYGGEIKVTAKMKHYFWHRYRLATGGLTRKKNGELRNNQKNRRLTTEAEFWKAMALKKVGDVIKIPKRQFIGRHPQLEQSIRAIIDKNIEEFFERYNLVDPSKQ